VESKIRLQVRFFASLVDRTGGSSESVELSSPANVEQLWAELVRRHPTLGELTYRPLVACDRSYAAWTDSLAGVEEVAFLPPVSGG